MVWWRTLLVALATLVVTKTIDYVISVHAERRNFKKQRRDLIHREIEELKNEVGIIYEIAANWAQYETEEKRYVEKFANDYAVVGKYNKYPNIARAAREAVHWCRIVVSGEKEKDAELTENKKELAEKFKNFTRICDEYVEKLV
ncbi:MAG: hypothetical protein ACU843_12570 [Gammaproteobacteria bacterium]